MKGPISQLTAAQELLWGAQGAGGSVLPLCMAVYQFWRTVRICRLHLCSVPVILTHLIGGSGMQLLGVPGELDGATAKNYR